MSTNEPDRSEDALDGLLHRWEVDTPLPHGFRSEVWRRIDRSADRRSSPAPRWFVNFFARTMIKPAVALGYLMILLAAGSAFGWSQAQREKGHTNELLGLRYVRSIDPYQRLR